jgi:hypothetical protein
VSEFTRGYLYGVVGATLVFLLWDAVNAFIAPQPISTKLVVLDRRDMAERTGNADDRTPDRMAGGSESGTNP